jgi:BlaI family transcriptional regulator, penicillinase repressor
MAKPEGNLTPMQHEIVEVLWDVGEAGATVTGIWEVIGRRRDVTRTTVLNLVERLKRRGWLTRRKVEGQFRFFAAIDRESTARKVAAEFVDDFFGGSAGDLVMSLLGSKRLKPQDVERIRRLLKTDPELE